MAASFSPFVPAEMLFLFTASHRAKMKGESYFFFDFNIFGMEASHITAPSRTGRYMYIVPIHNTVRRDHYNSLRSYFRNSLSDFFIGINGILNFLFFTASDFWNNKGRVWNDE